MLSINTKAPLSKTLSTLIRNTPYMLVGRRLHEKVEKFLLMNKYVNSIFKLPTYVGDPDRPTTNTGAINQILQAFVSNTKRSLPMLKSDDKYEVPYLHLDKRTSILRLAIKDGSIRVLGRYLRRYLPEIYQFKYLARIGVSSSTSIGSNIPYTEINITMAGSVSTAPGVAILTYAMWLQIPSILKMLSTWHRKALHAKSTTVNI